MNLGVRGWRRQSALGYNRKYCTQDEVDLRYKLNLIPPPSKQTPQPHEARLAGTPETRPARVHFPMQASRFSYTCEFPEPPCSRSDHIATYLTSLTVLSLLTYPPDDAKERATFLSFYTNHQHDSELSKVHSILCGEA